jgi:hypothetical protein
MTASMTVGSSYRVPTADLLTLLGIPPGMSPDAQATLTVAHQIVQLSWTTQAWTPTDTPGTPPTSPTPSPPQPPSPTNLAARRPADPGSGRTAPMPTEAHLQMIQAVISRLAAQSTTVKGWSITLTGALLGYGATATTPILALIAAYVVLAFAALDGYYLSVERAYRGLYTDAVAGSAAQWSLTVDRPTRAGYVSATLSPANVILYGTSLLVVAAVGLYLLAR